MLLYGMPQGKGSCGQFICPDFHLPFVKTLVEGRQCGFGVEIGVNHCVHFHASKCPILTSFFTRTYVLCQHRNLDFLLSIVPILSPILYNF